MAWLSPHQWWSSPLHPPDLLTPSPHLFPQPAGAACGPEARPARTEGRPSAEPMSLRGNASWGLEGERRRTGDPREPELIVAAVPRPVTTVLRTQGGTQCCGLMAPKVAPETSASHGRGIWNICNQGNQPCKETRQGLALKKKKGF